ncbi:hypothetical protein AOLI_G00226740 [Acnodon oligacanthus]
MDILATIYVNVHSTTNAVCKCGKVCKNLTGLKIHQTKMGCMRKLMAQHTVTVLDTAPGATEEEPAPDRPHSAQNLLAPLATPQSRPSKHRRILWTAASKESKCCQFDIDVDTALEITAKGDVDQRLWTMSNFIMSIASNRKKGKERARKHSAFIANPFGFTKMLLGEKCSGQLICPEEDINCYLSNSYTNSMREQDLGYCAALICPPEPSTSFNINEPTLTENVANRLMGFLLKSTYIGTSVQKGGVPGVSGYIEHTGVATQLIRKAWPSKVYLAVLWLDLANAYGSIPHKLVEVALSRYHVPEKIQNLILDYYNNFSLTVSSGTSTSE